MSTSVHLMSEPEALRAKVTSDWSCPAASPARGPGREHTLQQEGRTGPCTPSAWAGLLHSVSQRPSHGDQSYGQSALKAGGRGRRWSDNMRVAKCSPTKVPTPRKSLSGSGALESSEEARTCRHGLPSPGLWGPDTLMRPGDVRPGPKSRPRDPDTGPSLTATSGHSALKLHRGRLPRPTRGLLQREPAPVQSSCSTAPFRAASPGGGQGEEGKVGLGGPQDPGSTCWAGRRWEPS